MALRSGVLEVLLQGLILYLPGSSKDSSFPVIAFCIGLNVLDSLVQWCIKLSRHCLAG
jgi:hypothetical protein